MNELVRWQQIEISGVSAEDVQYLCFDAPTPSQTGLLLRVWPAGIDSWLGNFQRSITDYTDVIKWEEASRLIVIAWGSCYFVKPEAAEYVAHSSGGVLHRPVFSEDRSLLFIADYCGFRRSRSLIPN
jgi:hypothetical protein